MPDSIPPQVGEPAKEMPQAEDKMPSVALHLFAETVDQAPVAISITDAHANILYVNQAFTDITGYAPEESVGRNESMLSDKRTPQRVYQSLWQTLQSRQVWRGRLLNRHKDGHRYLADLTIAPVLNEERITTHYVGMHRDVTEVYGLEQKTLNQKLLIETVVDSMPVAAVLLDEAERVILDNQMYKALTSDLGLQEPVRNVLDILRTELATEWERMRQKCGGFRNHEIRFDRGGRHTPRWLSCAGSWFTCGDDSADAFFYNSQQTYFLLTLNDITQLKRHEEEIRINALRALMAEEEKIQSLRETLSGAIHHIQGPINLLNAARTMLQRRGQAAQSSALIDIIEQVIRAGGESIAQLKRCIPDAGPPAMTQVNLNQLIHETLILLTERLLACGVVVDWKPTPLLPSLMGYESRLRAMFKQLVENAIDAMNQHRIRKRELRITTWSDQELINICLEDTGCGIPQELRVRVFEPFFSTKSSGATRHSGMGLVMAQEVVNQHQGLIRIDPTYHEGCRVHIQFNLHVRWAQVSRSVAHG